MNLPRFLITLREADDGELDEAATAKAAAISAARSLDDVLSQKDIDDETKGMAKTLRAKLRSKWEDLKPKPKDPPEPATEAVAMDNFVAIPLEEATTGDGEFDVRVIGVGWGSSGYYSADTLKKASESKVFPSGTKMFWNHPTKDEAKARPERDLRDLAGVLKGDAAWQESGPEGPGLYAPIKVVDHYKSHVKELAPYIGVSIRGEGSGFLGEAEGKKGRIIEAIVGAKSVDFVTAPGAGGRIVQLFEAARPPSEEDDMGELEEARRERDEATRRTTELEENNRKLTQQRDQALTAMAVAEAQRVATTELVKAKLPPATKERIAESVSRTAPMKDGQLDQEKLKTEIQEAVKAESAYLEKILGKGKITGLGEASDGGDGGGGDDAGLTLEEADKRLDQAFERLGVGEKVRAHAVNGR